MVWRHDRAGPATLVPSTGRHRPRCGGRELARTSPRSAFPTSRLAGQPPATLSDPATPGTAPRAGLRRRGAASGGTWSGGSAGRRRGPEARVRRREAMARSPGGRCALLLLLLVSAVTPAPGAPARNAPGVPAVAQHWARPAVSPRWDSTGPDLRRPRGGTALGRTCGEQSGQNHSLFDRPIQALVT